MPCPSVHRRYESDTLLNAAALEQLGADAGADDWTLSGTCEPDATTGTYTVCTGEGTIGDHVVTVSQAVHRSRNRRRCLSVRRAAPVCRVRRAR